MIYSSKRRNPDDMILYCILGFFVPGLPRFLLDQIGMGILYFFTWVMFYRYNYRFDQPQKSGF